MRKWWRSFHLWVGLTVGMILVLTSLTGSAIVFYRFLEEQIYSDVMLVEEAPKWSISLLEALESAEIRHPDKTILAVLPPRHENATYLAYRWHETAPGEFAYSYLSIDPRTGEILAEHEFGKTVMTFLYMLHYTLTLGPVGALIVGLIGLFFIVSMLVGLYLWWPKAGKWKQALWFKKNAKSHRRNFDIHRVFGFYPIIIMLTIAFSGVYMIFPDQVKWGVTFFSELESDIEHETKVEAKKGDEPIAYEEALDKAQLIFPDLDVVKFDRPHDEHHPIMVSFADPEQPMTSYGYNQVFIEPYTGEILYVKRWSDSTSGDAFLAWQYPLHNGEAFGLVGRWIILISGFIPPILYVTGLLMWLKRRKRSKKPAKKEIPLIGEAHVA